MRRWYILGFILLIVIGIAVYHFFFKKEETEGFQSAANNVVYLLNNPSDQNGVVLRNGANSMCGVLGGRLAKYSELRNLTFPNPTVAGRDPSSFPEFSSGLGMFVYDTDVPYFSNHGNSVAFGIDFFSSSQSNQYVQYRNFRGYPISYSSRFFAYQDVNSDGSYPLLGLPYCYGPYPGPNVNIVIPGGSSVGDTIAVRYDVVLADGVNASSIARPTINDVNPTTVKCSNGSTPTLDINNWMCDVVTGTNVPKSSCTGTWTQTVAAVGCVTGYFDINGNLITGGSALALGLINKPQETRCANPALGTCTTKQIVDTATYKNGQVSGNQIQTQILPIQPTPGLPETQVTGNYKILDLDAVYLQFQIGQIEFPIRYEAIKREEQRLISLISDFNYNLNPSITANLADQRIQGGYTAINNSLSDYINFVSRKSDVLAHTIWNYTPGMILASASNGQTRITGEQYTNLLLLEIQIFYDNLMSVFQSHPLSFILKGVSSVPSLLNTLPVFNHPAFLGNWIPALGGCSYPSYWRYGSDKQGMELQVNCTMGGHAWGHEPHDGWGWPRSNDRGYYNTCVKYSWGCNDQNWYNGFNCTCAYALFGQKLWTSVGFAGMPLQENYENNPQYAYNRNVLDSNDLWRPKSTDPSTANMASSVTTKFKNISFVGYISPKCFKEVQLSVSVSIRFKLQDTSLIEKQIRISSNPPNRLYMSPDASAVPEYITVNKNGNITIKPANNYHNNIHCNIEITKELFFLIPFHARKTINDFAVARYNTVQNVPPDTPTTIARVPAGVQNLVDTGNAGTYKPTIYNNTSESGPPFSSLLQSSSIHGIFFDMGVDQVPDPANPNKASRQGIMDMMAQMYYEKQLSYELQGNSVVKATTPKGQSIIYKFYDVFTIGTTILDVRFEEHSKRSMEFLVALEKLEKEYDRYMAMNLSKDDLIAIEKQYITLKKELYDKDSENLWGAASNKCGTFARYVKITTDASNAKHPFNLSQIVVVDNAGKNAAWGCVVTGPPCVDFGPSSPGWPSASAVAAAKAAQNLSSNNRSTSTPVVAVAQRTATESKAAAAIGDSTATAIEQGIAAAAAITTAAIANAPVATGDLTVIPLKIYVDNSGNLLTDRPTKKSPSSPALSNQLSQTINNELTAIRQNMEQTLTDGVMTPRWYPNIYRTLQSYTVTGIDRSVGQPTSGKTTTKTTTCNASNNFIIVDLGTTTSITAVRLVLPMDVNTGANPKQYPNYTISLLDDAKEPIDDVPSVVATVPTDSLSLPRTLVALFPNSDPSAICPNYLYDRYKVARFYFDPPPNYDHTDIRYWKISGYSLGIDSALTFNSLYNGGKEINLTLNGGFSMYKPKTISNLNLAQPDVECGNPDFVKQVFSDYRTIVNDTGFRSITGVNPELNIKPNRLYRPDIIYGFSTLNSSTCGYYWSDRAIDTSITPNLEDREIYYRQGSFNYVFNTEDWGALDRTFVMTSTFVLKTGAVGSIANGKVNFSNGANSGYSAFTSGTNPNGFITFPNPYIESVKLDTAGGFCPALSCSDPAVMESLIGSVDPDYPGYNYIAYYNNKINNLTSGANGFIPIVSQVYKAITPSSNECEYLVDMTDNPKVMRKLYMFINVIGPEGDKPCRWTPDRTNANTLSLDDSLSPHMVDSVPYLTRFYNYASDVMAPYVKRVKSIVGELTTAGNAQLDPAGSGIISALVKYRTDTKAAAGEMRYIDDIDEFGNKCADTDKLLPASSSATVPTTANLPRCRSRNLITSLLKYYGVNYAGKRLTGILGAGQTVNGECDYSFTAAPYTASGAINQGQGQTTGLRCSVKRIPFSCEYDINTCTYINPTPSVGDLQTYPAVGSGSTGIPAMGSGQYPSTEAPENVSADLQKSRTGPNAIPQPPAAVLDSVDWINCSSDYAKAVLGVTATLTNSDYTTCKNGGTQYPFKRGDSNTNYLFSPVSTPASNTLGSLNTPVSENPSALAALLPFIRTFSITTINAGSVYEFRVTDRDTLDFGSTYVRAEFFNGSNGKPQLKVLRAATPSESPNAFLRSPPSIDTLVAKFLDFWNNQMFVKGRNKIGIKIGRITGYFMNTTNDSVVFRATAANFGNLGEYDILKHYPTAYYEVYFRKKFSDGSLMIYKTTPGPSDPVQTANTSSFTEYSSGPSVAPYAVQDPARLIRDLHLMRYVRFVVKASNGGENVEIARLGFWSLAAASTSGTKYDPISAVRGGVSVEGVLTNYNLPAGVTTCKDGYTLTTDPLTEIKFCQVTTPITYPLVPNTACSLGFINMSGTCTSTGYFQELINVGSLFFGNSYTSRLRLKVNQRVTIDFNNISPIDGFSFITGSQNKLPLQWLVEGSINGMDDWITLHNQTTNFAYNNLPNAGISAFYNPGVFQFTPSANSGADPIAQGGAYSANVKVEGFKMKTYEMAEISDQTPTMNYRELTDQPLSTLYDSPLKAPVGKAPMFQELDMRPRIKAIRFRTLETQNPDSPFVHMSMLRFHTRSGIVPPECIQISNSQGSRRSAKDRPDSLLAASPDRRWVDYNKSELLVQFKTEIMPADPVDGIQFYVPRGFANAIDGVPAKWRIEGSYDRRTWFLLHEKVEKARIMGESSPVYRFENVQI